MDRGIHLGRPTFRWIGDRRRTNWATLRDWACPGMPEIQLAVLAPADGTYGVTFESIEGDESSPVVISRLVPFGAMSNAGAKVGDRVEAIRSTSVLSARHASELLTQTSYASTMPNSIPVDVVLERKLSLPLQSGQAVHIRLRKDKRQQQLGVTAHSTIDARVGSRCIITRLASDTPLIGLRVGDELYSIDGVRTADAADALARLCEAEDVMVVVMRDAVTTGEDSLTPTGVIVRI